MAWDDLLDDLQRAALHSVDKSRHCVAGAINGGTDADESRL